MYGEVLTRLEIKGADLKNRRVKGKHVQHHFLLICLVQLSPAIMTTQYLDHLSIKTIYFWPETTILNVDGSRYICQIPCSVPKVI